MRLYTNPQGVYVSASGMPTSFLGDDAAGRAPLGLLRAHVGGGAENHPRLCHDGWFQRVGNLWRRLVLPARIDSWSLTSLQQRLVKTGGRLVTHARYYWLMLAEGHPTRRLCGAMLQRISALPVPTG